MSYVEFSSLIGKILISVTGGVGDEEMLFRTSCGKTFRLYHSQDCCESCSVEEIHGDISDLLNTPVMSAELVTSGENPPGVTKEYQGDSFTWSFYKIATIKGSVTIRWYGESNGYYSETAYFEKED